MRQATWSMLVGLAIGGAGCGPGAPGLGEPGPDAAGGALDAAGGGDAAATVDAPPAPVADPAQPGPWAVGVRTVQLTDPARNRRLPVEVWYPVDPAQPDGSDNTYELDSLFGPIAELDSPARRDATPAAGPWPLMLFSHGYGGIRFQSYFVTEHLASHGFVVIAPDHPGNTLTDFAQLGDDAAAARSAADRPLDMRFVLDRALDHTLGAPVTVDPARVAITGHSFGGWTSLEVARRDPRIGAILPMAPGFRGGATPDFVATLHRPILIMGGSEDATCPFATDQQVPYDVAATPKHLLEVMGAGHLDFSNLCEVPLASQLVDDGCDPARIDPAIVHARVRTVAAAFALRHVAGNPGYDVHLRPDRVTALGNVAYWSAP